MSAKITKFGEADALLLSREAAVIEALCIREIALCGGVVVDDASAADALARPGNGVFRG